MAKNGFISEATAASVDPAQIRIEKATRQNSVRYFTDWALPQLDTLIDATSEPIDVWTTLDPGMQAVADRAIPPMPRTAHKARWSRSTATARFGRWSAAGIMSNSIYNRATQATRQPGSAFKLFVYLTALESGMKPTDTIVDEPITINGWSPRNSTRTNLGPVSLREAFSRSINTISAKIGAQLGFSTIADMARRFGITTPISTFPSMVLGTSDVRLIDMTRAFAAVNNRGVAITPYAIRKVVTADGRLLYQRETDEERVLVAPWVAAEMTDLLQSAVLTGTGRAAQIGRPVAGKTGTTTLQQGRLVHRLFERADDRRVDGPRRCASRPRAPGRHRSGARVPRFHDGRGGAPPGRSVRTQVPMPDWQLTPEEEMFGDSSVDQNGLAPLVDANGNPLPMQVPQQPGSPPPMVRPDGTGEPTQQELDQAFPPRNCRCRNPSRASRHAQPPPPQSSGHRPIRRSRGASRLRLAFAAARPLPYRCASSALNAGPWLRWTRWATSCATT